MEASPTLACGGSSDKESNALIKKGMIKMIKGNDQFGIERMYDEIYQDNYANTVKCFCGDNKQMVKKSLAKEYKKFIEQSRKGNICIPTKIDSLDKVLGGGLKPGLHIFGANPGIGKTSLILHIMESLAISQQHSVMFNMDMANTQVLCRLLANCSYRLEKNNPNKVKKVTINDFLTKKQVFEDGAWNQNVLQIASLFQKNIDPYITVLSDSENDTLSYVETIETTIRNYIEILDITPVVVIDFLQLMQTKPVYRDEDDSMFKMYDKRLDIDEILLKLKRYSNLYQIPIIIITSISRSSYTKQNSDDNDTEYSMAFGKESGAIEYRADFLALLTKGKTTSKLGGADQHTVIVNVLKSRACSSYEKIYLNFIPEYSYLEEVTED